MTELTKRLAVGGRYLSRQGLPVGPVERIDPNGWAWCGDQCWDALTGQYYANIEDDRDLVAVIPEEDFQHWLQWIEGAPPPEHPPDLMAAAS